MGGWLEHELALMVVTLTPGLSHGATIACGDCLLGTELVTGLPSLLFLHSTPRRTWLLSSQIRGLANQGFNSKSDELNPDTAPTTLPISESSSGDILGNILFSITIELLSNKVVDEEA